MGGEHRFAGVRIADATMPSAIRIRDLNGRLDGELLDVQAGFDTGATLHNGLRQGPEPYFKPSTPK